MQTYTAIILQESLSILQILREDRKKLGPLSNVVI